MADETLVLKQTFGPLCLMCSCPKGGCSGRHGLKGRVKCHCANWGFSVFETPQKIINLKGVVWKI